MKYDVVIKLRFDNRKDAAEALSTLEEYSDALGEMEGFCDATEIIIGELVEVNL